MSTLEAYFKGEKELFQGLKIADLESEWKSYPVFRFDLSPTSYIDSSRLTDRIKGSLKSIASDYSLTLDGPNNPEIFSSMIIANFDDDIIPLLYQSGYLTIKGALHSMDFDDSSKEYILGFPNREVNKAFWESLSKRFFRGEPSNPGSSENSNRTNLLF